MVKSLLTHFQKKKSLLTELGDSVKLHMYLFGNIIKQP